MRKLLAKADVEGRRSRNRLQLNFSSRERGRKFYNRNAGRRLQCGLFDHCSSSQAWKSMEISWMGSPPLLRLKNRECPQYYRFTEAKKNDALVVKEWNASKNSRVIEVKDEYVSK